MKKILIVVLVVGLMLGYVWMRSINNRLAEKVALLEREATLLEEKMERQNISLNKQLVISKLEPRARSLGLCYPWEAHGSN